VSHDLVAAEREQLPGEGRAAVGGLLDALDVVEQLAIAADAPADQATRTEHDGQQVVEVVRDTAGETANRLHLAGARQLLVAIAQGILRELALGDRLDDRDRAVALGLAALTFQRGRRHAEVGELFVGRLPRHLDRHHVVTATRVLHDREQQALALAQRGLDRFSEGVLRRRVEHLGGLGAPQRYLAPVVATDDRERRGVDQRLESLGGGADLLVATIERREHVVDPALEHANLSPTRLVYAKREVTTSDALGDGGELEDRA
jgi:hypothetical protein